MITYAKTARVACMRGERRYCRRIPSWAGGFLIVCRTGMQLSSSVYGGVLSAQRTVSAPSAQGSKSIIHYLRSVFNRFF